MNVLSYCPNTFPLGSHFNWKGSINAAKSSKPNVSQTETVNCLTADQPKSVTHKEAPTAPTGLSLPPSPRSSPCCLTCLQRSRRPAG